MATSWLGWRIWRFSISPVFHPEEPRELPYWIPFIGHAWDFVKNQDRVLTYGREYFGNAREPFAITLGHEKLYILTSSDDVVSAYKNYTTLDYGMVIKDLMCSFGVSPSGVDKVYNPKPPLTGRIRQHNPQRKSLFYLKSDFYHYQLHPGEQFNIIQERFLSLIDQTMTFDTLNKADILEHSSGFTSASLWKLCQPVFIKAGIRAFFGSRILDLNPRLLQDFVDFDDNNWMIFYDWPSSHAAREPKDRVLKTLELYLALPKVDRPGTAWLIDAMEESQEQLGMEKPDIAVVLMMLMWVVAFWMIAYILHSDTLHLTIKAETAPAFARKEAVDVQFLTTDCPHLDSLWFEVLRLTNASSAMRTILEPTQIGSKVLKPGYKVMSPFRQLHFDKAVFGNDVDQCDPSRFFRDKALSRHPSYKPFGGGRTMCPGRFVARQEVYVFITLLLHRFDVKLIAGNKGFPRFELDIPTTGIISPKQEDDVLVLVQEQMR